ncbi:MAG: AMP-binding protein, partial [Parvularculaceae bacterium]|nr:AMP-binding protein [Parvularculaceae bacterium]
MTEAPSATRKTIAGRSIRWDERRAADARAAGLWGHETLAEHLARAALETPDRVVLVEGEREIDCRTLHAEATALAHRLSAEAPPGSVVSFMLPNWPEAAVVYLAATIAGMVAHPILPSLREHDLGFALEDSESRFIFIPETFRGHDYAAMLSRVVAAAARPPRVVVVRGASGPHAAYADYIRPGATGALPKVDPDAVRLLLYTSGTTGRPKGVLHTHNTMNALVRQIGAHWLVAPGDAFLVASPVSHIGGSIYAFECPLLVGATAILMERWDADEAVRLALRRRWTHMAGATPFLTQLLAAARAAGTRIPDLKVFICGGASVPPALIR